MSLDDDLDAKAGEGTTADDDVEMPDYGGDDDEVEVIEDDDDEKPASGEKRKPEGLPESSAVGAAAKVATKKTPKPSEPAPRRKVQKIVRYDDTHERDVPQQLQPGAQAYIGPEHNAQGPGQTNEREARGDLAQPVQPLERCSGGAPAANAAVQ